MSARKKIPATGKQVPLDGLLDWITGSCYSAGHGLLDPCGDDFVVDAEPLLDKLRELAGMTRDEMADAYDWARVRVHGPNVEGGR